MWISVVTTMYRSAPYVREFHTRIRQQLQALGADYEVVLVNDGSLDNSLEIALELQREDPHVVVIDLSRNFGHHRAIMAGLAQARGERIFLIDCDLEEPPELLGVFHERFERGDCDVVYGVQQERMGGVFRRVSGALFYRLFNWLSPLQIPRNLVIARLMSRRYVEALLEFRERELFFAGLLFLAGFKQVPVLIEKTFKGESSYSLARRLSITVNSIISFSDKPLRLIFYSGALISLVAGLYIINLVVAKLFFGVSVDGWTSLIVSVWFLGGLTILFLGTLGMYISKIFLETKARPNAIVRQIFRGSDGST